MRKIILGTTALMALAACGQATDTGTPAAAPANGTEVLTVTVPAAMETVVLDNKTVDADDPVLWADAKDPARALLIGTDKTKGLYVHDLSGKVLQFFEDGPMNNVDLRPITVSGRSLFLVSAAERDKFGVMTWLLDPATLKLERWGHLPTGQSFGEPYGYCMGAFGGETYAIANNKNGAINAYAIGADTTGKPQMTLKHQWKVETQTEGCVVNDSTGDLYVGEEDTGIWKMNFGQPTVAPLSIARVDGQKLVDDVEGLTILRDGGRNFLIASSQGDSAYAVYEMQGGGYQWVGRFRIGGGSIDPVTQTDGLDAWSGPIGPYPEGAIAFHDHCEGEGTADPSEAVCESDAQQQNYKLVDWREIKKALKIQ